MNNWCQEVDQDVREDEKAEEVYHSAERVGFLGEEDEEPESDEG